MNNLWAVFGLLLLGSEVMGGQAPARGQFPPAVFTGTVQGFITSHTTSLNPGGDTVTVATDQEGLRPTFTFRIGVKTTFYVWPMGGQPTQMAYKEIASGELKRFSWYAESPLLVGKSMKATIVNGVAQEVSLFPSCIRERCSSPACKRKCKASSCVCPAD